MERFANLEECEHGVAEGEVCSECVEQAECDDMFGDADEPEDDEKQI